jgi:hypothetical protein
MPDELEARMDAVRRFTVATQGEAVAKTKMEAMRTVGDLQRAESDLAAYRAWLRMAPPRAQVMPPSAAAPAPEGVPKIDEPAYAAMSARDRMFYCRQFDQRQFDHTGGRR